MYKTCHHIFFGSKILGSEERYSMNLLGTKGWAQGDTDAGKNPLHRQGYVFKHKNGDMLLNQVLFFPFHILGILHFISGSHGACYSVHLGLIGSVPSCLWEGVPPPHLHRQCWCLAKHNLASWELEDRGVWVFTSSWERQACWGQTGRWSTHCVMERDGEGLSALPPPFSLKMLMAQKMLTFHCWRPI